MIWECESEVDVFKSVLVIEMFYVYTMIEKVQQIHRCMNSNVVHGYFPAFYSVEQLHIAFPHILDLYGCILYRSKNVLPQNN